MPFLPLSWAARVKPLDNKADGNLCLDLWESKKSSVLFSPGLNTTLRDIFVFTAATPPRPQKNVQPNVETHLTTTLAPNPKVLQGRLSIHLLLSFRATLDPEGKRLVLVSDGSPEPGLGCWVWGQ